MGGDGRGWEEGMGMGGREGRGWEEGKGGDGRKGGEEGMGGREERRDTHKAYYIQY